jgi:hypothetical protein
MRHLKIQLYQADAGFTGASTKKTRKVEKLAFIWDLSLNASHNRGSA